MESCRYEKLNKIVLDKEKFQEINISTRKNGLHPILKRHNEVKQAIEECVEDKVLRDLLTPTGSVPGQLYGLCKVHKAGNPMRPVISMIGTPEFGLAKYLDNLIKPYIPQEFVINSTFGFVDKLKEQEVLTSDKMYSFDVCSLFTQVPLEETIYLIADTIYSDEVAVKPPFTKESFIKLLKVATGGMFMFNNKFYQQVDGVAMGSPLGPTFANFFLGHIEEKMFATCGMKPKLYLRYVDDIFALFDQDFNVQNFFDLLNKQHKNLTFTLEESNGTLPFLDVEVEIKDNSISTSVYRKPTHTGVLMNFSAVTPKKWKHGLILGALFRARNICSSIEAFENEVVKLKEMCLKNGYSMDFFDKSLFKFRQKLSTRDSDNNTQVDPGLLIDSVVTDQVESEWKYIFKIPFVGDISYQFQKEMISLFQEKFNVVVKPVFTTFKVGDYFSLKSRVPSFVRPNVVYRFKCLRDADISYIGKTERHLVSRVAEHLRPKGKTHIRTHLSKCSTCLNGNLSVQNFEILKTARGALELGIQEALLIRKHQPKINKQMFANGASHQLKAF